MQPNRTKIQDRLRPPYNYALMNKIKDNTMDYKWSEYDDGYYRTGKKFEDSYVSVMKETNDMSHDNAYEIYKKQKKEIATKYKLAGESLHATKENMAVDEFSPKDLKETEAVIVTDENEFAVTKDITIHVDQNEIKKGSVKNTANSESVDTK